MRSADSVSLFPPSNGDFKVFKLTGDIVEHNSAGIVTEKSPDGEGYKPIHVVTKVDLLSYLVRQEKREA